MRGESAGMIPHRVLCIGNATVDRAFALTVDARLGTKNPAVARETAFGGVARNVAENLARLGVPVALIACVGDDRDGHAILADCRALGIDVRDCVVTTEFPTPQYGAILDVRNDLIMGASDMRAIEALPPERVLHASAGDDVAWTFADCNLNRETLAAAIAAPRAAGHRIAINTVSVAKASRLPAVLHGIDLLFCNVVEAQAYLTATEGDPERLAQALHARGAHTTVMTLGDAGAIVAGPFGIERIATVPQIVTDVTGAGDALIAGTLYAMLGGASSLDAVRVGMAVASLAVEAPTPVNPAVSPATVRERLA
jgi:pseudouridine kinase